MKPCKHHGGMYHDPNALCRKCGGAVSLYNRPPLTIESVDFLTADGSEVSDEEKQRIIDEDNSRLDYYCIPCFHKQVEAAREDFRKGNYLTKDEMLAEVLSDERWQQRQESLIAEVKECGPECELWPQLFRMISDYRKKYGRDPPSGNS